MKYKTSQGFPDILEIVQKSRSGVKPCDDPKYRGYYYDTETGFYYLQTRYFDPEVGRFLNADRIVGDGLEINGYNIYSYCSNNPISRIDKSGTFWDTIFDVISLVASVIDVIQNPDDPMAWAGLAGDAIDLIPFVSCVGETIRGINVADNIIDAAKTADRVVDAVDAVDDVHDVVKVADNVTDSISAARSRAVREAWQNEFDNVASSGRGKLRVWDGDEIDELLTTGKVKGYIRHTTYYRQRYQDIGLYHCQRRKILLSFSAGNL